MKKLILGDYSHGDQKAVLMIIFLLIIIGAMRLIFMVDLFLKFLLTTVLILVLFYLLTFIFGKKGLLFSKNQFYYGIVVCNKFLIKWRIKTSVYSHFEYKLRMKSKGHWFFDLNGLGIFYNHHECLVFLANPKKKKKKLLISLAEAESYREVKSFIIQNSNLKELKK